jgi:membrane protein implicated in regulation of membrane protease activity
MAAAALLLFAAEAMAPGAFMLWFGFAAAGMAMVVLLLPGIDGLCRRSCSRCSRWFRSAST